MKKYICLLAAAAMLFLTTACSKSAVISDHISEVSEFIADTTAPDTDGSDESAPETDAPDISGTDSAPEYSEHTDTVETAPEYSEESSITADASEPAPAVTEDGIYTTRDDVALYLHLYGHLPENFITKKQAQELGWNGGSLEPYAPGKCIGGSRFGNYEGLLPEKEGRSYTECDIDTLGADSRGAKRLVFSNDGLIYYTDDHYESFTLLYGEE